MTFGHQRSLTSNPSSLNYFPLSNYSAVNAWLRPHTLTASVAELIEAS